MLARNALANAQSAYPRCVPLTRALTTTPLLRRVDKTNTPWDASSSQRKGPNSFRNDARPGDRRPPFVPFRQPGKPIRMPAKHFNMPGIGDASPLTPESIASWIRSFPLDRLEYDREKLNMNTRMATPSTYVLWDTIPGKGIRVVYDQTLNERLYASLKSKLESLEGNVVTPDMEEDLRVGRRDARSTTVRSEHDLCDVMLTNFFKRCTDAINAGLPGHLHGEWQRCSDDKSGSSAWEFRRDDKTIAIVEIKLRTVLTTAGEGAVSQTGMELRERPQGDTAGRGGTQSGVSHSDQSQADKNVPDDEQKPDDLPPKLEQLLMACRQEGGLKLILADRKSEDGRVRPALRIVDQEGKIVKKMTHWADGLSQVWKDLDHYELDLVTLSSYEVWIPFERDPVIKNLLRVGDPIHRKEPGTAPEPGKMSPMELVVASVIEREPAPPFDYTFSPLPVWSSSEASGNDSTQNDQNESGVGASELRGTKSGYDNVGATGGAGSDDAIDRDANIPTDQLAPVTLQVSVPNHRSRDALHYFKQRNLDNGYMAGRLSPCVIASSADDDNIHSGLPTSELKAHLALGSYISSGRLWDVYHSVLTVEGRVSKKLIAKVMCPDTYDEEYGGHKEFFEGPEEAVAAYRLEAALYSGPLKSLQGGAVPAKYGSFSGVMRIGRIPFPLHIELMEDVGGSVAGEDELEYLPLQDRQAIRDLYHQIHAVRVLHCDVEARHILRRADGRFALIDFDASFLVGDGVKGDRELALEGREVAVMLGLSDLVARKAESRAGRRHLQREEVVVDPGAVGRGMLVV
ncbi:hypothetical protein L198_00026 [Cryptococcus wingfieldii CBS 7118]|uniref:Protein kinase domain-containing protein n=1 Tax=Cryptococcus wingfieldii CBS 7118 TaxID=1295528 RepID=A0A1E3K611_9TREE|nr:hypothetical protein L198_00026 [Cryptococcus wingfieldii CBS 7118]ODO08303.1 hypothetical protein L198_00026 [Cryptococcus wingfieldii CBS 7118]